MEKRNPHKASGQINSDDSLRAERSINAVREILDGVRQEGKSIGFVPTMGALHEGHASLINRSVEENDYTVVSIFVNPIQFDNPGDLAAYPSSYETDKELINKAGANLIFLPEAAAMYPDGFATVVDVGTLTNVLCGVSRPGHFRGVSTAVSILFNIIGRSKAYFGQKDYQQLLVVRKMVKDLHLPVKIVACPTQREPGGLACSSRNERLTPKERDDAACLFIALERCRELIESGERESRFLIESMAEIIIGTPTAQLEYVELVSADTLEDISTVEGHVLAAIAVQIDEVRLIDNMLFSV